MLRIEHLTKTYRGGKKAVEDLSLHIQPGDIYGFIGHNGAGKTTTLRSCCGILDYEEGKIWVNGHELKENVIACKQDIAFIPDNPDLYEYLTGIQYLQFICDIYQVDITKRKERIKKYADTFELTMNLGDLISSYSHGMKQKLALISAFVHQPKLLMLDEPFVGLDPKAAHLLKGMMKELCEEGGAISFSTHVLDVAEKLCNKVAIIKQGKLITSGTIDEVKGNVSLEDVFLEMTANE